MRLSDTLGSSPAASDRYPLHPPRTRESRDVELTRCLCVSCRLRSCCSHLTEVPAHVGDVLVHSLVHDSLLIHDVFLPLRFARQIHPVIWRQKDTRLCGHTSTRSECRFEVLSGVRMTEDVMGRSPPHQGLNSTVTALSHWTAQEPLRTDSEYRPTQASDGHTTDRAALEDVLFNTVRLQQSPGPEPRRGSEPKDERVRFCSLAPGPSTQSSAHDEILILMQSRTGWKTAYRVWHNSCF